jgi:senataxin
MLMEQAEIVFTTLSSTGRRAFLQGRRFDLVLIDEAAQASEVATLQPLALGSGR